MTTTTDPVADLAEWLATQTWSDFATDLARYYRRTGTLSERQVAAAERMRAKITARAAAEAAVPERPPVTEPGFYLLDAEVWRVQKARHGDHLYAKRRGTAGGWEYVAGGIRRLSAEDRITPAQAAEHGLTTGICIFCDADLDDRDGLGHRVGVGPVCARKHLGMTQRQLAEHLGL
jgi:hypothetical protein